MEIRPVGTALMQTDRHDEATRRFLREYASGHFMKWNLKHPENMLYKM
jgi:hypothetical protein